MWSANWFFIQYEAHITNIEPVGRSNLQNWGRIEKTGVQYRLIDTP